MSKKVNHIILNDELQIDLRNDTVTADALKKGVTAHDRSGEIITGTLEDPILQEKTVIENGEVVPDEGYYGLSKVKINVPIPEGYIQPSGSIELDENKTYDITNYKNAIVRVLQPQLYTPSIALSENRILTIEDDVKNGAFTTEHDIYIDSTVGATVAVDYPIKTAVFDLKILNLATGSYNLTVKAKGAYMIDSEKSTTVIYTVLPNKLTAPTISIIDNQLYIRDNEGYATFFNILVDGEPKDSISKFGSTGTFIYNLTNLGLSAGEYTITVIAEAANIADSEPSEAVVYVIEPKIYDINIALDGCEASAANATSITEGSTTTLQFNAQDGYVLPETISVTGATYVWDSTAGTVVLSNPTGDVNITITCVEMPQLDPAVISLDGDILNIYDTSGLATSATIYVDGEPMATVEIEGEVEEPTTYIIPDGCTLEYWAPEGDIMFILDGGEPFPQPIPDEARLVDCNAESAGFGPVDTTYFYQAFSNSWSVSASAHPFAASDVVVHANLGGAPVTALEDYAFCSESGVGNDMSLQRLYLPTSITYIGYKIFDGATAFTEIIYAGTIAEWNNITFHESWNSGGPAFIVTCTDGTINVPAGSSDGEGSE